MILALEYQRSPARYLAARGVTSTALGSRLTGMVAGNVAPLRLMNRPALDLPLARQALQDFGPGLGVQRL